MITIPQIGHVFKSHNQSVPTSWFCRTRDV